MDIKHLEDNIEFLAERVHDAWQKEKMSQGFHAPNQCPSSNRHSYETAGWQAKERFDNHFDAKLYHWCDKCHKDLYPYNELDDNIKEFDRVTVRTVLNAIKEL